MSNLPSDPDALACAKVLAVRPQWVALRRARDQLGLRDFDLLCAGPPLRDLAAPCAPVLNAAASAALLEGWASTPDQARDMVHSGRITLRPAQELDCVVPLADVVSPSMWVQVVRDGTGLGRESCSPLNGGMANPMRVGMFTPAVVEHLRWLDQSFAPALQHALDQPIDLLALADEGLCAGDDCHGKTAAATRALAAALAQRLSAANSATCTDYLAQSPGFFLNLWMAASRCMLSAASGTPNASVVTAAAGNGLDFGIQLAGLPGRWFTHAADAPRVADSSAELKASSLGAIGDSAIVDLLGLGAMKTLSKASAEPAAFAATWPGMDGMPRVLLRARHPAMERAAPMMVLDARTIVRSAQEPLVSLGVVERTGQRGRLAGGFYRAPAALFAEALAALGA